MVEPLTSASLEDARAGLQTARRIVVKIGSSLLTDPERGLDRERVVLLCEQINDLLDAGREVLLVSSGAVAEGCSRLGWKTRPESVHELQAAAAVGQMGLIQAYETAFQAHGHPTALVLLTHDDLADRRRYLNARATLTRLLELRVVPVVNENDTVATDEIRFGDNDTLAALVTNLLEADLLVVLTDIDGLYARDPREDASAELITATDAFAPELDRMAGGSSGAMGRGGMLTKIRAARLAARSGAHTVIANGRNPDVLGRILRGEAVGTLFGASMSRLVARKRWIAGQLKVRGDLVIDAGARVALVDRKVSLLPVGVQSVTGRFVRGDVVRCVSDTGEIIAQGLVNYGSDEIQQIKGLATADIAARLGYVAEPEVVHRDNLVVLD